MKVAEKYKQTEVGLIPSDWEVKLLEEVSEFSNGKAHEQAIDENGDFVVVNSKFISTAGVVYKNSNQAIFPLKKGDITMVMSDIPNGKALAKCYLIEKDNKYTLNQRICSIKTEICDNIFLYFILNRNKYFLSFDSGSGQTNLRRKEVLDCPLALPPTKAEQTAIATALSDADALISSLEKLIAKKRMIKQGAMQQLLQQKEGWLNKSLGEIGEITGAGVDKLIVEGETPVRLVNYMDVFNRDFIFSKELNHWVTAPSHKANKCSVKQGDIFFTPSSEIRYDIAVSAVAMEDISDAVYSYHLVRLRLFEDWDLHFRTYIFKTEYFLGQAEQVCEGSGKRYVITLPKFRSLKIFYPPTKEEQTQIATILSDMDAEIAALETKLEKYRKVKMGMMQNLLTGKIRLV